MPELPDVLTYVACLERTLGGRVVRDVRVVRPFLLRTFDPPLEAAAGRVVVGVSRIGKRVVLELANELFLVVHLMIAGRLRWFPAGKKASGIGRIVAALLSFEHGELAITEASAKKRASLHVISGREQLGVFRTGGVDVLSCEPAAFRARLRAENHTLKRSLTDPRAVDGVGNAYSDEILHAARLSPLALSSRLSDEDLDRLLEAARRVLSRWTTELALRFAERFPGAGDIAAFRAGFAVHGRFGRPCPDCGSLVQRIRYADNETNYCARCQTGGRRLADRSLSRLLKDDWPRNIDEIE